MKTCPKCGNKYPNDKKFCIKDGTPLIEGTETTGFETDPKDIAQKSVFEDRLKADPLNVSILHEYAQFLFNKNNFKDAIVILHKILVIKEDDTIAQSLLYKSYLNLKKPDEAFAIGIKLLNSNPQDEFLLADLGNISFNNNKFEEALNYFDRALSINPNNKELWIKKAISLKNLKKHTQALSAWQKVFELDNNNLQARYNVGISCSEQKDYNKAVSFLDPVIDKLDNEDEKTLAKLYYLYSASKLNSEDKETIRIFKTLDEDKIKSLHDENLNSKLVEILIYFGQLSLKAEDINYAISLYSKALNIDKNSEEVKKGLGDAYYKNAGKMLEYTQYSNAKSYIEDALKLVPQNKEYDELRKKIIKVAGSKKKKLIIAISTVIILILGVIATIFIITYQKQESAWSLANKENTFDSYQTYLTHYPEGNYIDKAKDFQEKVLWNEALKTNTTQGYDNYIYKSVLRNHTGEAESKKEDAYWNEIIKKNSAQAYDKYLSDNKNGNHLKEAINNFSKLGRYSVNFKIENNISNGLALNKIYITENATIISFTLNSNVAECLRPPGNSHAMQIKDKKSGNIYNIISASIEYNKAIYHESFEVRFEKIPYITDEINIYEGNCNQGCWNFSNIDLKRN